jgi:hypothetical protein
MRDIGRQGGGLTPEQRADQADTAQRDEHTHGDRSGSPQSDSLKHINKRREDEGQHDGQRNGNKNVLSDVQRRNHDRTDSDRDQGPELRRGRGGDTGRVLQPPQFRSPVCPIVVVARQLLRIGHDMNVLQ